ncbi:abortive infection family protein [Acinetobacter boissieri]|uniref:Abortive infection C-terminus n=1 Tax=Acinetobacter boissieri TaxID=1219383 RepID=A0A1G6IV07_9GAMM|nr:abortive infection family protein [Acinetobacter boissieri]SDC10253.1 hypothetical protein SAMN05421733_10951 [Acinetobacter boissieri]
MERTKNLIKQYSENRSWLQHLDQSLEQIDHQATHCGDALTECTKSFIECIAKNIIVEISPSTDVKSINLLDLGQLFKSAKNALYEHSAIENIMPKQNLESFFSALNQWIRFLGEVRNNTGEISHGKILPKSYSINLDLAKIFLQISDGFSYILVLLVLEIDMSYTQPYKYEDYQDFNEYLDELYELPNSLKYSKALFDQDYDAYVENLDNYNDQETMVIEEEL